MLHRKQLYISLTLYGTIILAFGYYSLFNSSFLSVFFLIAYVCYTKYNDPGENGYIYRTALKAVFIASAIAFVAFSIKSYQPRDWDFTCFFLYGNVAAKGLNFYDPQAYYAIIKNSHIPIELSAGFIREVVDVGCPYPPPTLLLFSVLGFFSYDNGLIVWTIIQNLFLLGSILLMRNIFFKKAGSEGILIATILILNFHASIVTVFYTQILFILLFFLLLFYKYKDSPLGGIFLAFAIFLKPFAAILFIYYLLKKQWNAVLVFVSSSLIICFITVLLFGIHPFIEYLVNNPTLREPALLFTEDNNQSLLAELFRYIPEHQSIAKIAYYFLSGILASVLVYLFYKKRNAIELHDIFLVLLLTFSLIVYPSGQCNYPVVHLLSLLILLNYFKKLSAIAVVVFLFYLVSYAGLFHLNILLLFTCFIVIYSKEIRYIFSDFGAEKS